MMNITEHTVRIRGASAEPRPTVDLRDVTRIYRSEAGEVRALDSVSLEAGAGEFLAIVGKSGSGKSTLLNIVSGVDRADEGVVVVGGADLAALGEDDLARWRGASLGVVFQFQQLMPTLTVAENVQMPMDFLGDRARSSRREAALDLLERVGLADQAPKFPSELSGGQQQRVAIARALANDPVIVAADEPTGNLDSPTADGILDLFRELAREGRTVLMVTHERDIAPRVDRVVTVADGRIVGGPHA